MIFRQVKIVKLKKGKPQHMLKLLLILLIKSDQSMISISKALILPDSLFPVSI
jgi:hypothetical protein